ncbi:MAG TPA: hypothetical protein VMB23_06490 [Spirochaetia bacterium]|nr:hypothetical protein [Spirochaetia bacterium]
MYTLLTSPVPTLVHEHFDGWNTRSDGQGTKLTVSGTTATPSTPTIAHRDEVLYAWWNQMPIHTSVALNTTTRWTSPKWTRPGPYSLMLPTFIPTTKYFWRKG